MGSAPGSGYPPSVPQTGVPAETARPLRVGMQLPEVERVVPWSELRDMAIRAEEVGLDSLWVGDHLLYRDDQGSRGPWEAWSTLAALAAVTKRVQLGPLVAATSFHAPAMLAKKAAAVDEISGGRLMLGLGAGWNDMEYRAFGFPFDQRVSRFEEAFTIIRTLLREGAIDFHGRFHDLDHCELLPRGGRPGGPPLMIGSIGERMLRISVPYVDAWNVWFDDFDNDPALVPPLMARVDAACEAANRDPATLERTVAVYVRFPGGGVGLRGTRASCRPITGEAEAIANQLRAFAAVGIDHVQLVLDPVDARSVEALSPVLEHLDSR